MKKPLLYFNQMFEILALLKHSK